MLEATQSVGCSPIKPSFRRTNTETLERTTQLLRQTNSLKNLDEDTVEKLKGIVQDIEVDPKSKVQGPLKTLVLSVLTLATGTLLSRGTATKLFYTVKDRDITQKAFTKLGKAMANSAAKAAKNAEINETAGAARKYFYKGVNCLVEKAGKCTETGLDKNAPDYMTRKAENLVKKSVQAVGSAVGLTTTGAALSVDKNGNGKSDMLESRGIEDSKKTQKAVIDLASAVLEAV